MYTIQAFSMIQKRTAYKEAYCDCPAFRSYSGICKHCVAVLLEYGDRKAYERVEIRSQQDRGTEQQSYSAEQHSGCFIRTRAACNENHR